MEDFNWVSARCECSPNQVFELLKSQVKSDVQEREASLTTEQKQRYRFSFTAGRNEFSVLVEGSKIHGAIKFGLTETGIVVLDERQEPIFGADVTISDDGKCKLKVDDEEKELWQVRKMALEQLFFMRR